MPLLAFAICCCARPEPEALDIRDYGAIGDGHTINTASIQKAIDHAHKLGGKEVFIPQGTFVTGTIYLKSNVTLRLMEGSILLGSPHLEDYPLNELETIRSYTERYSKKALIYAEGHNDIAIVGRGTIDGNNGSTEFGEAERGSDKPLGIKLVSCKGVTIRGVRIVQAGLWLQHYLNCEDLKIQGITAINHGHFTNDGLDIDGCRNVLIENIYIDSHDDALVFKSTGPAACENITVRHCILKSHCHGLKFGTETTGGFRNIDISNIQISPSDSLHPKTGVYWKVNSGVALEMTDGGTMQNISIRNLIADSVYAPIFIKLGNRARKHRDDASTPLPGTINGIHLGNFRITNAGKFASSVTGFPDHKVRNVVMENIYIQYDDIPSAPELFDVVPEHETRYPEVSMFTKGLPEAKYIPAYGLYARHVDGLVLKNFEVETPEGEVRPKFKMIEVDNLSK